MHCVPSRKLFLIMGLLTLCLYTANDLCAIDPKEVELVKQIQKIQKQKLSHIPPKALEEQLAFNKRTKGCIILYGNGDFDYQVTILSEMCSRIVVSFATILVSISCFARVSYMFGIRITSSAWEIC